MSKITIQINEGERPGKVAYALTVVSEDEYPRTVRGALILGDTIDVTKLVKGIEEDIDEDIPEILDDGSDDEEDEDDEYLGAA